MGFSPENIKIKLGITGKTVGTVATNIQVMHHNPYMKPPICYTISGLKVWIRKVH